MVLAQHQERKQPILVLKVPKKDLKKFEELLFSLEIYNLDKEFLDKPIAVDLGEEYLLYKILKEGDYYYFTTF